MPRKETEAEIGAIAFTAVQVAEKLQVSRETVELWIRRGELKALNASLKPNSARPRLRVTEESLAAFMAARSVGPPAPRAKRFKKPVFEHRFLS